MIRIPAAVIARIRAAALATPGHEVCGLLVGDGGTVTAACAARNVSPRPARAFEIDPAVLLGVMRAARAGGPALLGSYHSHPGGRAAPSTCDAANAAADGRLWLILGAGEAGLWRAVADGPVQGRFAPVRWACVTADGVHDMPAVFGYGTLPIAAAAMDTSGGT